ncbi:hypothetical protein BAUCODRAFT_343204 [Baudoinia panamericana UAMH 10762]|uniref:Mediator of RNA polymerase II transcription subunit 7 n=1 Tax=Baudoinia panamericana (strain UAMH 10762) TaxID=717646 RepID=M2NJN2_BAUPA|nr:uncharacterized protein BAUCODRAFT_343204 [Baudoinia panamericana UAMH 10762]EMC99619.1 hypothetical protein BAUCODRAFT_343204 [Baudoinia panamericana UAMH 10762]
MADQQQGQAQAQAQQQERMQAPFPQPPPFYKHFTPDNLAHLRKLRKEAGVSTHQPDLSTQDQPHHDIDIFSLPTELRYLIPPPPPPTTSDFLAFGLSRSLSAPSQTLAELNIESLLPPGAELNPGPHLISLARSHLATFLLLVGNLSQNPAEGWEATTKDLEVLVANMHEAINRYRPHQARETLIGMMEERVERMREEVERVREAKSKVRELLEVGLSGPSDGGEGGEAMDVDTDAPGRSKTMDTQQEKERRARQMAAWAAIEDVMNSTE